MDMTDPGWSVLACNLPGFAFLLWLFFDTNFRSKESIARPASRKMLAVSYAAVTIFIAISLSLMMYVMRPIKQSSAKFERAVPPLFEKPQAPTAIVAPPITF